jgi:ubiquinone/menaquinone biosynthesis C-methylase UbiE
LTNAAPESSKQSVRRFYEGYGWKRNQDGFFTDASRFEDLRPVSAEYRSKCHLRVNRYLGKKGAGILLDVASGPIQYPEHRSYSDGFEFRICGDMSMAALREARRQLGDAGRYVQCDITHLPFKSAAVDAAVSLHTIYHVPAQEQGVAFEEVVRVLKQGCTAVIVYDWANHSLLMTFATAPRLAVRAFLRGMKFLRKKKRIKESGHSAPELYFHPHGHLWVKRNLLSRYDMDIMVWRSVSIPFLRMYIHQKLAGRLILRFIYRLEEVFPGLLGRLGAYPMFIIRKACS